ncbi:MOSC domain-containing protein [Jatrophihabitans sp.]|uniref:MOSC domain-containing protein n=1 Tax=Jatrophihabitans sp. TaxID=1932789 RepID=UPI002EEEDD96
MSVANSRVLAVNLAHVIDLPPLRAAGVRANKKPAKTGIDKRPVAQPVQVRRLGLDGDSICDTVNHGGPDQAVYAYASEDTEWWQEQLADELDFRLQPGSLGENLTLRGVDVTNAVIGERWRVGRTILQVAVPRIPCSTFAAFWNVDRLPKRFIAAGRPGAYLRVLTEGAVGAGDEVRILERPAHGLTLAETLRALTGDRSLAPKLLTAPELPESVHRSARTWLGIS